MSRTASDQFHLPGAWNFRDVGGLRTIDGSVTREGVLYRSSALSHLSDAGRDALDRIGVTDVYDFRGDAEVNRAGADHPSKSVEVHVVPYRLAEHAPHENTTRAATAREYLDTAYRTFPTLPGARVAVASVARAVARGQAPILVHCAAGKDRAGWAVATVLRAAGVIEEDIIADYLLSNDAVDALRGHILEHADIAPEDLQEDLLGVREEYYRAGLEAMDEAHGSFDGYLDWLGVDSDTVAALRRSLVL